jgi:hypothetical protein
LEVQLEKPLGAPLRAPRRVVLFLDALPLVVIHPDDFVVEDFIHDDEQLANRHLPHHLLPEVRVEEEPCVVRDPVFRPRPDNKDKAVKEAIAEVSQRYPRGRGLFES